VHFLSKYDRAKREKGMNTHDAIRFAFDHVGNALWVTTVILVAGFSTLAFSVFALNVQLGVLTAITLASALALDFLLLPALLMWIDRQEICTCNTCAASADFRRQFSPR
ncbi:MAG: MMPL family transporter, partial [Burkholderiales bacterium]|nr:MMPL family transporter [Burkholderiales bacterium]